MRSLRNFPPDAAVRFPLAAELVALWVRSSGQRLRFVAHETCRREHVLGVELMEIGAR